MTRALKARERIVNDEEDRSLIACSSTLRESRRSKDTKGPSTRSWKFNECSNRWRLTRCGMELARKRHERARKKT